MSTWNITYRATIVLIDGKSIKSRVYTCISDVNDWISKTLENQKSTRYVKRTTREYDVDGNILEEDTKYFYEW